jgi:hypothetical protein
MLDLIEFNKNFRGQYTNLLSQLIGLILRVRGFFILKIIKDETLLLFLKK